MNRSRLTLALLAGILTLPAAPALAGHREKIEIAHDTTTPTVPGGYTGAADPVTGNVPQRTEGTYEKRSFTIPDGEEHGFIRVWITWPPYAGTSNNIFNIWLYRKVGDSEQFVQKQVSGSKPERTLVTTEEIVPGDYVVYIDNFRSTEQNWRGEITFGEPVASKPPVAVLTPAMSTIDPGESVTFDASGSHDRDAGGAIREYRWDLDGNGLFDDATGESVEQVFEEPGTYYISVKVIDTDSRHAFGYAEVEVVPPPPPPPPSGGGTSGGDSSSGGGLDGGSSDGGAVTQDTAQSESAQEAPAGERAAGTDAPVAPTSPAGQRPADDEAAADRAADRSKARARAKAKARCLKKARRKSGKRRRAAVNRCKERYAIRRSR